MQLTREIESEILETYETWLHSYLNGDVATYDSYFDDTYHFIGSTINEEFLNRKETTNFFKNTAEQLAGKSDVRNEIKILEQFGELIFITHAFDAWFLNGEKWFYYGRFRFSSVMQRKARNWKFIYQHFSTTDAKADAGETIGFEKVNAENQELRDAIKRRTFELEEKNRELEVEGALERIRAQAVAMQQSSDLLDIVVTMRNEFTKLGHEAHYFWHMMWLPETYEKAMTSGDGSKIGFVMTLPRHMHGDIPLLANWEESDEATVIYPMNTKAAISYVDKMVQLGDFKNIDPQAPTHDDIKHIGGLTFIMARTTHGEIGYSLPGVVKNPPAEDLQILVQFAGAFDLAHRRFLDLQKAEKQAREVQIELALEKVRSRTMAMQHSDELQEASFLLDQQVRSLGIRTRGCAFNIYGQNDATEWFSSEQGTMPVYRTPRENVFLEYYEAGKRGESLYIKEFEGDACAAHYDYLCTLPVMGKALRELKANGGSFPEKQIDHATFFKYGYLLFITLDFVPEAHDIFKRFAKVFEQTYTRFLDLQKAEAQAREAQIEAALERVRSRSLAMHHSSELSAVVDTLLQEFTNLEFTLTFCIINLIDEEDMSNTVWAANPETGKDAESYYMKFEDYDFHRAMWNAWKAQDKRFVYTIEGEEKKIYDEYLYSDTEFRRFPKHVQEANKALERYVAGFTFFKYSGLQTVSVNEISEADLEILERFGKVFEQAYTRFLDLQKAEAQAREAKIEVALEKIRSRTMGMQKAEELGDVAILLFDELNTLVDNLWTCGLVLCEKDRQEDEWWLSADNGLIDPFFLPNFGDYAHAHLYEGWEKGENYRTVTLEDKQLQEHYDWLLKIPIAAQIFEGMESSGIPRPSWQRLHAAYFKTGYLVIITEVPCEAEEIFKRFAQVFDLTYTRFLDLQKAEAQAREAKIEVALEKVRSRTMGMQSSDELPEVANLLFNQIQALGIPAWSCGYNILFDDKKSAEAWMSSEGTLQEPFKLRLFGEASFDEMGEFILSDETMLVQELGGKELEEHYTHMKSFPDLSPTFEKIEALGLSLPTYQINHLCKFSRGFLLFITYKSVPEAHPVFKRFTNVFDQTYTRFLDLQKAEAQAREAQIEAALERTRTQSMLMQRSDELSKTTQVFHEQLQLLGIDSEFSYLWLPDEDEKNHLFWATWDERHKRKTSYKNKAVTFPLDKSEPSIEACYVAWESGETVHVNAVAPKDVNDYFNTWSELLDGVTKFQPELFPDGLYYIDAYMDYGCFGIMIKRELDDDEKNILNRFSKEFQRTYTRFLDLQKAEAQAREAQIETALERVRSRSMGMQKSEELKEVIKIVYQQLTDLKINLKHSGFVVDYTPRGDWHFWIADEQDIPSKITHPYFESVWANQFNEAKEKGANFFTTNLNFEEKNKFYKELLSYVPDLPKATKDFYLSCPGLAASTVLLDSIGLYIENFEGIPYTEEENSILLRFAKVFEQTYIRFLDLQKAEAQAREAQIEAALEKVRSRSMGMQKSTELLEVILVVSEQLQALGFRFSTASFLNNNHEDDYSFWVAPYGLPEPVRFILPYKDIPMIRKLRNAQKKKLPFFTDVSSIKEHQEWFQHLLKHSDKNAWSKEISDYQMSKGLARSVSIHPNIMLAIANNQSLPYSDYENKIIARFGQVFEQSYTRFLDLEKAEAQAREAQIEAALEKVRSRSLEMSESSEMQNVANEILEQVRAVGLKIDALAMSGVIDNDSDYDVWVGGANSKKPLRIPYNNETQVQREFNKAIKERPEFFAKTYTGKVMKDYFKALMGTGNSFNPEIVAFMKTCTGFTTTLTFMKNSGIQLIRYSEEAFSKEDNAVIVRFGRVFEQAYIRFLDLQKAEEQTLLAQQNLIRLQTQKQRAEEALSELQQTQTQLIQSEKMASLGELTAGIAHEIQNPLNFVNNFSEVSKELLEEMKEEIENGDFEEVKAIMEDVIQNLEKINHHGKRADGIVKGMLQHSRSSTGTKEPTDINALADEYLRLAYHGLRAKDKSFNAELITDFDESIEAVNVIPQDIGRVILNLITNAFYATNERKQVTKYESFKPTVSVCTKKTEESVQIWVKDNGKGIPKNIVDKIFQPFFTTKPTGQGTGLGLSMSYDIVTKGHGGELKVETNEGEGSVFTIVLPVKAESV